LGRGRKSTREAVIGRVKRNLNKKQIYTQRKCKTLCPLSEGNFDTDDRIRSALLKCWQICI
jgi:hypothetical protein